MKFERNKEVAQFVADHNQKPVVIFLYGDGEDDWGNILKELWDDPARTDEFAGFKYFKTILPELNKMNISELLKAWAELGDRCTIQRVVELPWITAYGFEIGTFQIRTSKQSIETEEKGKLYLALMEAINHHGWEGAQHINAEARAEWRHNAQIFKPDDFNKGWLWGTAYNKDPVIALLTAYVDYLRKLANPESDCSS